MIKFKSLNDGTNGYRFNLSGLRGLYRIRATKRRLGFTSGDSTIGVHIGKLSVYVNRPRGRKLEETFAG